MTGKTTPEIRPATAADLVAYYGGPLPWTVRAWVADLGGDILGVVGMRPVYGATLVFSDIREDMRRYPVLIYRVARWAMEKAAERGLPVMCLEDRQEETAPAFLTRLGWELAAENHEGRAYIWHKH